MPTQKCRVFTDILCKQRQNSHFLQECELQILNQIWVSQQFRTVQLLSGIQLSSDLLCKKHVLQSCNMRHRCSRLGGRKGAAMKPQDRSFKVEPSSYSKRCPSGSPRQPASAVCYVTSLSGRDCGIKYRTWQSPFRLTHMD